MTKVRKIVYGSVLAAVAVLLVIGGLFDVRISNAVYQSSNLVARILEGVGFFPPFFFVAATFAALFFLVREEDGMKSVKKALCVCLTCISYLACGFVSGVYFFDAFWLRALVAVGTAIVFTPLNFLLFRNKSRDRMRRYAIFLIFASIVSVISALVSVNVIKYLWGRPRYREMLAEGDVMLEGFTAWYHPNGFTLHGHHSFPSGHVCSATCLLALCALDEVFPSANKNKKTVTFIVAVYIFVVAYSRVVLGAHFLSDVTAGFLVGFISYAVTRYIYFDKSKAVVNALLEINQAEAERANDDPNWKHGALVSDEKIEIEIPDDAFDEEADHSEGTDEGLLLYHSEKDDENPPADDDEDEDD